MASKTKGFEWTPDKIEIVKRDYPTRRLLDEIAREIGAATSTVIHFATKLKLERPAPVRVSGHQPGSMRPGALAALERGRERPTGRCEWPMWEKHERPTHVFCGKKRAKPDPKKGPKAPRPVYCDEHLKQARTKLPPRPVVPPKAA
jgi:hypothetical protein